MSAARGGIGVVIRALAVVVLQYFLVAIITLLGSFPVNMDADVNPWGVLVVLTITSLAGTTVGGWIGLRSGWLQGAPLYRARILAAAVGVIAVFGLGVALGQIREASPFLTVGIFASILGFHIPGWLRVSRIVTEDSHDGGVVHGAE